MTEMKYDIYIDGDLIAENMELQYAILMLKALFETYYNETQAGMEITIKARIEKG